METKFEELKSELDSLTVTDAVKESIKDTLYMCVKCIENKSDIIKMLLSMSFNLIEKASLLGIQHSFNAQKYDLAKDYFQVLVISSKAIFILETELGITIEKDNSDMPTSTK